MFILRKCQRVQVCEVWNGRVCGRVYAHAWVIYLTVTPSFSRTRIPFS